MWTIYGLSGYGAEPVEPISMFATVLHLPESEDIWPGEWVSQFPQAYFAARHNGKHKEYLHRGSVAEHLRHELLRMTRAHLPSHAHELPWSANLDFFIWIYEDSLLDAKDVFDSPEKLPQAHDYQSLDVELEALDESMIVPLRPHRPVGLTIPLGKSPTEQED